MTAIVAVCLAGLIPFASWWTYGSPLAFVDRMNGRDLSIDRDRKSFEPLAEGEQAHLRFVLRNISDRPVRILGGETDCGCLILQNDFPAKIEPGKTLAVNVHVAPPEPGPYEGRAILYTSARGCRTVELRVQGERSASRERR